MQGVAGVGVPVGNSSGLVRLWAHEAMRVFHDRLVSTDDRAWFCGALKQAVDKHWPQAQFAQVFPPQEGQPAQVRPAISPQHIT
jgi:dynein heavy chain